jgi:shikimate kinase/3-dehydroquinate synthase
VTEPAARGTLLLWGFMGAGKSTVARLVADRAGAAFVDLDAVIAARAGSSVAAIFASRGEAAFRAHERAAANELLDGAGRRVVALGGGTLLDAALRLRALDQTFVVVLEVDEATVLARTRASDRPLLQGPDPEARVRELLAARQSAYAEAHARVDARGAPERVAGAVCALWHPR